MAEDDQLTERRIREQSVLKTGIVDQIQAVERVLIDWMTLSLQF
jgi:hypothetical protein